MHKFRAISQLIYVHVEQ